MNIIKPLKVTAVIVGGAALTVGLYSFAMATQPRPVESEPAGVSRLVEAPTPTPTLSVEPTVEVPPIVRDEVTVTPPTEEAPAPEPVVEAPEPVNPEPAPVPEGDVYDPETDSVGPSICEVLADGTQVPCQ